MNAVESLKLFFPELCLIAGAFSVLAADLFIRNKKVVVSLTFLTLIAAAALALPLHTPGSLFFGFFTLDSFTYFFRLLAIGIGIVWVLLSISYPSIEYRGEYFALTLFMTLGLILMAAATNLLMIFIAVEFVSILSYLLTGFEKKNLKSKEASMKYMIYGSAASALMLYGMSFLFGATGSIELSAISAKLDDPSFYGLTFIGCILLLAGLGFKISMAPFHAWAPDVYEGAPTPVTAFLTVGSKALGFAVLIRVLAGAFHWFSFEWGPIILALSVLTMTVGNLTAVAQTNVKRLLAYSSIAQAGYILMGLAAISTYGLHATLFYLVAYTITNLGVFAVVITAATALNSYELESYRGLSKRAPFLSACMVVFLLSLAGIPPLAGFFAKLYVFSAVIEKQHYFFAAAAAVNSAIAAFYYLKVIRQMYLVPATETSSLSVAPSMRAVIYILLTGTLLLGIMPDPFIGFIQSILPF